MSKKDKTSRILIIEDDEDTNDLIRFVLEDSGFEAISAFDGESGCDLAQEETPDAIVLDLMLPRIDGIEVCRRLSSNDKTRSIPVIILTAKRELSTKLSSFVAGAKRFMTKPFESEELISEINRTIRQRQISGAGTWNIEPRD